MTDPGNTPLAERVRVADLERYAAARLAPPELQAKLFTLYAFNLEVAAAPWRVSDPQIGAIRLKWLVDRCAAAAAGAPPADSAGAAVDAMTALIAAEQPPIDAVTALIEARARELDPAPTPDTPTGAAELDEFIEGASGSLLRLAAFFCFGEETEKSRAAAEDLGFAMGAARVIEATPAFAAAGRVILPIDPTEVASALGGRTAPSAEVAAKALAARGLSRFTKARRAALELGRPARPAFLAAWRAPSVLRRVVGARSLDLFTPRRTPPEAVIFFGVLWRSWFGRI